MCGVKDKMEILKGSVNKIVNTQRSPLSYDDDGKPFSSLFRKNRVSFYDDLRTEAVLLLVLKKGGARKDNPNEKTCNFACMRTLT